jgi:glycine/D-amino acid oxidase-like deaminating enzyme/nitrite reductase/ring-hydroxylating ferredoxin subunit
MANLDQQLPQFPEPYWLDSTTIPTFQKLEEDVKTNIAIVGGGITGITAAYLLTQQGFQVTLIEAGHILTGTTGHTTAKITAQHGLIYDQLIQQHGLEQAKLYYEANREAIELIKELIDKHSIECDFSSQDAYVYGNTETSVRQIKSELLAYQKLGIPGDYAETIPFSIPCQAAIIMKDQAQFHPLKYLTALIPSILENGGKIYEKTTALKIEDNEQTTIVLENGRRLSCNSVIVASHFPFSDEIGLYFARMHAERSYILAIKAEKDYPSGMYYSADSPTRSLRYTEMNGEKLILVGGEGHKTGQGIPTHEHYLALQDFSEQYLGVKEIPYRWSAQDMVTPDKIPFVGPATAMHPDVLIATGYAKWGMTNGTIAAKILTDTILQKENRYTDLYNPSRLKGWGNMIKDNVDVAKHLIEGKLEFVIKTPDDLTHDEGDIVTLNGKRAGCYRDPSGHLHLVDSTCTHMGCEVNWNSGERTWDCPCHGSRYSIEGEVLEGPAVEPLKKLINE